MAHPIAYGCMVLVLGVMALLIAGHELAVRRAEHDTLFFRKLRVYDRDRQPKRYWFWVACHGLGGLAFMAYAIVFMVGK